MDKMLEARLDVIDATNEAILKRQGILAAMVSAGEYNPQIKYRKIEEMAEVLDEWTLKIKDIEEKYKNGA